MTPPAPEKTSVPPRLRYLAPARMKLSIIIPCYNEAKTIRSIVERVRAAPVADKEIISSDDSPRAVTSGTAGTASWSAQVKQPDAISP